MKAPKKHFKTSLTTSHNLSYTTEPPEKYQFYWIGILIITFTVVYSYIFDKKHDLNGDNAVYYTLAQALAQGKGYVDITTKGNPPTNAFPPGYPLIASLVMFFTDSLTFQHLLNGLFLIGSILLLFLILKKLTQKPSLSFVLAFITIFNSYVLRFSTMMMTEMSYLFFSCLAIWLVLKVINLHTAFYRNPYFYLLIIVLAYAFYIRTQGITIVIAVMGFFFITKRWKEFTASAIGFLALHIPWALRNKMLGIGGNRYLSAILSENVWRPEEGTISISRLIERFFETQAMLLTKAIPDSLFPFLNYDYQTSSGAGEWLIGISIFAIILWGMWKLSNLLKLLFILYFLAVLGIIGIWSAPSGNRYLTTIIPLLQIAFFYGVWYFLQEWCSRTLKLHFSPYFLLFFVLLYLPTLKPLNAIAKQGYPAPYANYFAIGEYIRNHFPDTVVTCCRKPNLLYLFSRAPVCNYTYTNNDTLLIQNLIAQQVDLVVLEQLGYSSTGLYLYPAIQKNPDLFTVVIKAPNPDTYLLQFNRQRAMQKFGVKP
ncbi:MAG: hypothetical protein NZM38_11115 [Cytophagales bacterium]|nr:hypothetical protein [Cytophagales bacterium]MDW8385305.1 hypothetical protein [Flammeovirgaceae bacterium]